MVAFLKQFFKTDQRQVVDKIGRAVPEMRLRIATCAILLEIANSDDEFSIEERMRIVDILRGKFELTVEEAHELIEISQERIDNSIDIWGFTNTISDVYSDDEKFRVLEAVWEVIYADGHLSGHEDSLVHKLSFLLGLKHDQLIEAKLRALGKK